MRNTARRAATPGLPAAAVCGPLTGAAVPAPGAVPSSRHAPSALVLTIGHGDNAVAATPERAVTLNCAPTASGTHPAAARACAELRRAGGDFGAFKARDDVWCAKLYDPVVVTVRGGWQANRVCCERAFGNSCVKDALNGSVFAFWCRGRQRLPVKERCPVRALGVPAGSPRTGRTRGFGRCGESACRASRRGERCLLRP